MRGVEGWEVRGGGGQWEVGWEVVFEAVLLRGILTYYNSIIKQTQNITTQYQSTIRAI